MTSFRIQNSRIVYSPAWLRPLPPNMREYAFRELQAQNSRSVYFLRGSGPSPTRVHFSDASAPKLPNCTPPRGNTRFGSLRPQNSRIVRNSVLPPPDSPSAWLRALPRKCGSTLFGSFRPRNSRIVYSSQPLPEARGSTLSEASFGAQTSRSTPPHGSGPELYTFPPPPRSMREEASGRKPPKFCTPPLGSLRAPPRRGSGPLL